MANKERISGESKANIRVGPAGWSYSDWNGAVYPMNRPQGFHEAAYLAQYFSVIEINASSDRPLRPEVSRVWVQKLARAKNFEFTAKLYSGITHDQNLDPAELRRFSQGLEPLIDNGLLGCVLAQFPLSFRLSAENLAYVRRLARALPQYPLVAEFSSASWNNSRALAVLADLGIGFCNIDQPQLSQSMPPTEHATSPIGYVRLDGRNYQPEARSDHFYSGDQLSRWLPRIENLAKSCQKLYVVANNHCGGQSVANALQIESMISRERVAVPPAVLDRFPQLQRIALNQPAQRSSFFDAAKATRDAWGPWTPQRPLAAAAAARA
ncbi:MAG: DUF72 domain-containing protein [Acidobacteria bacterium]|nr:DUF72 domain-containing protein [Acidobacteriota bacterium]